MLLIMGLQKTLWHCGGVGQNGGGAFVSRIKLGRLKLNKPSRTYDSRLEGKLEGVSDIDVDSSLCLGDWAVA